MRTKIESSGGRTSNRFKVGIRTGQVLHSGLPPKSKDKPLTRLYVGVDVHKEKHVVALIPAPLLPNRVDNWEEVKLLTITNNIDSYNRLNEVISSYISAPDEAAIAIDYTGGHYSEPLVYFLVGKGYRIYFLEPKAVKAARERILDQESKSDVIDAKGAAYLLYLRDLHGLSFGVSAWTLELGSQATLMRSIVLQRTQFTKLAVQSTHRLRQLLHAVFPEGESKYFRVLLKIVIHYPTPQDIQNSNELDGIKRLNHSSRKEILELSSKTVGVPADTYKWLIQDLAIRRKEYQSKSAALTTHMMNMVQRHPYGHILLSFPFLGAVAAATIIAIVKDIQRWPNKKKLKKALGIYSSQMQSGDTLEGNRMGKEGSRDGRRVLFQICFGCIRPNAPRNDFRDYYLKQVSKGKPKMKALVAAMGKLAEIIYHCLKTGEEYKYQGKYKPLPVKEGEN
jgi:transposase